MQTAAEQTNDAAASDMLDALEEIFDYRGGADNALADDYVVERARAAIARAKAASIESGAAGVEDAEEQGERERSDRSEPLTSTGGRTEEVREAAKRIVAADAAILRLRSGLLSDEEDAACVKAINQYEEARTHIVEIAQAYLRLSPSLGEKE